MLSIASKLAVLQSPLPPLWAMEGKHLRIDNSWQGMICASLLNSAAILSTASYYTSNYRSYFSLSNDINYVVVTSIFIKLLILNLFSHFFCFEHGYLA